MRRRIANLHTAIKDLKTWSFDGQYDFISSTVVLMFPEANTIPGLSPICSVARRRAVTT